MTVTEVEVRQLVRDYLFSALSREIDDGTNIFKGGFVNSLFAAQLVLFVENRFALTVDSEDMEVENFSSIDAITGYVLKKTAQMGAV